jgi:hypothetical protein
VRDLGSITVFLIIKNWEIKSNIVVRKEQKSKTKCVMHNEDTPVVNFRANNTGSTFL